MTITADWRFESPHDLEAERVAAAFGGFTSCLGVAEYAVPALQEALDLHQRRGPVPVARLGERGWMVTEPVPDCECVRRFFTTASVAASHARDVKHIARKHGADPRALTTLLHAALAAQTSERPPLEGAGSHADLVREPDGLGRLWAAGVHPDHLPALADLVPGCREPLPVAYFLAVATRDLDRDWLRETLAHRPDPDVAAWVAWCDEAVNPRHGSEYGEWLALAVPLRGVEALVAAGVPPEAAHTLSRELPHRRSQGPAECAKALAVWAEAGCQPDAADLELLARLGVHSAYRPPVTAINLLEAVAATIPDPPTRTQLGVMLAMAGTRGRVMNLLDRGVRTPAEASDLL